MNTVYAVKYDPVDEVLHAATGENHRKGGFGFTFDASKDNFGDFIQKWEADKRVCLNKKNNLDIIYTQK